jgi:DNA-directed RNA polymerase subunit RPC12/RpoP
MKFFCISCDEWFPLECEYLSTGTKIKCSECGLEMTISVDVDDVDVIYPEGKE